MAIQIQGNGGVIAEVDGTTFRAIRVTPRPIDYGALGFYRVGATSGTMAAALGANSEIWQWRWPDATRLACVYRIAMSAGAPVAATTAVANASFRATIARGWSAAGTGGTRLTMTGNNGKLRTSMGTTLVNDIGICTTAALAAGTKTLDAQDVGGVATGITLAAATTAMFAPLLPLVELLNIDSSADHPIVLAQNEGYVIRIGAAMPAAMTWHYSVITSWAEVVAF